VSILREVYGGKVRNIAASDGWTLKKSVKLKRH
jgi:hypothetical protein